MQECPEEPYQDSSKAPDLEDCEALNMNNSEFINPIEICRLIIDDMAVNSIVYAEM